MIRFRGPVEQKFWGDVFTAARATCSSNPIGAADDAVIYMRIRQNTILVDGIDADSHQPLMYRVCAVCEGRKKHVDGCANSDLELPVGFVLPVID